VRAAILSHEYAEPARRGKLRALAGQGCTITAIVPGGESGIDGGVRIAPVSVRGEPSHPDRQVWSRRGLEGLLRDVRPDLVQIEAEPGTQAAAVASAAARKLGIPTVAFSWESLARPYTFFERRRRRSVLGTALGVIGGNQMATALLRAEAPAALHTTLPQFGAAFPPCPERPDRSGLAIGCVGRLVVERGVDQLLRACSQVMGAWTLTILGTGPEQESLEALAQRLGLASRLRWLGGAGRAELAQIWQDTDVLVVPSRATPEWVDRFNPVLVEAMSQGLAPVVMNTGALPETVGDAGMVVSDPESMALALQHLLAAPELRRQLGQASRRRALATFADTAIAEQTVAFWREVVAAQTRHSLQSPGVVA